MLSSDGSLQFFTAEYCQWKMFIKLFKDFIFLHISSTLFYEMLSLMKFEAIIFAYTLKKRTD